MIVLMDEEENEKADIQDSHDNQDIQRIQDKHRHLGGNAGDNDEQGEDGDQDGDGENAGGNAGDNDDQGEDGDQDGDGGNAGDNDGESDDSSSDDSNPLTDSEFTLDGMCRAFINGNGTAMLSCAASIAPEIPFNDGRLKVKLQETSCPSGLDIFSTGVEGTNMSNIDVRDTIEVHVSGEEIENAPLNRDGKTKDIIKHHCFRADYFPIVNRIMSTFSVLAEKWRVTTTYTYDVNGFFNVTVTIDEFDETQTSTFHNRDVAVLVNDDSCGNQGSAGPHKVGSILTACVYVTDEDVVISDIVNVTIQGVIPEIELVSENSVPSFVTSVSNKNTTQLTLKTLLLPKVFDAFQGGNGNIISLRGVAFLTYVTPRRLSVNDQSLVRNKESSPFSLEIQLEAGDIPEIAHHYLRSGGSSGARRIGIGIAIYTVGLLSMCELMMV